MIGRAGDDLPVIGPSVRVVRRSALAVRVFELCFANPGKDRTNLVGPRGLNQRWDDAIFPVIES